MRRFTPEEANAMLPRLQRDMKRIGELLAIAREKHREKQLIKAVGHRPDGSLIMLADYQEAERLLNEAVREIDDLIEAIHEEGALVKDLERGLVDFPAVLHGKDVLLCWQLGEERVEYFHDYTSGYAGRKRIPPDWRL